MAVAQTERPVGGTPPAGGSFGNRWAWATVAATTVVVAATWAPWLAHPLGDNHPGRIAGRYALHLRNLQEHGLLGSTLGADWSPYASSPYAHHPPLRNLTDALVSLLPGAGEWQLRLVPFLIGLLAVPAAAALLRELGLRWPATLLAVGLMVTTGYFWVYGQLCYDLGLILALAAPSVRLRHSARPPRWLVAATCLAALLAALQSWPGIAFAVAATAWLLASRRDRVAAAVAGCVGLGVAASVAYMFGIHGVSALASQTELRTAGGDYGVVEFVRRQLRWAVDLLPVWYLLLLPLALVAGLVDRRTRWATAVAALFAAGWVLVLNHGAFVHDYWGYLVLIPGLLGMAALAEQLARRLPPPAAGVAAGAAALVLAGGFASMVLGETAQRYVHRPAEAGRLVTGHEPATGQRYAWHGKLGAPRWLAYYWDLRPRAATPELLAAEAGPDDLVVVRLDRPPQWLPEDAMPEPVAQRGDYALFRAADLAAAAED